MPSEYPREQHERALAMVKGIEKERARLSKLPEATAEYHNGDDWGSIDGIRDAAEWVECHLAQWISNQYQLRKWSK